MTDFKFFTKCIFCKKWCFFIKRQTIQLPVGPKAVSKDLMCGACKNILINSIPHV